MEEIFTEKYGGKKKILERSKILKITTTCNKIKVFKYDKSDSYKIIIDTDDVKEDDYTKLITNEKLLYDLDTKIESFLRDNNKNLVPMNKFIFFVKSAALKYITIVHGTTTCSINELIDNTILFPKSLILYVRVCRNFSIDEKPTKISLQLQKMYLNPTKLENLVAKEIKNPTVKPSDQRSAKAIASNIANFLA